MIHSSFLFFRCIGNSILSESYESFFSTLIINCCILIISLREIKIGCAQPIFLKQFICVDMEAKD